MGLDITNIEPPDKNDRPSWHQRYNAYMEKHGQVPPTPGGAVTKIEERRQLSTDAVPQR